uniref:Uncharacterized protein n=1 Tax=Trichogramma kaykai TaxID=54128 RepID=A0ABD2WI93_9HYME
MKITFFTYRCARFQAIFASVSLASADVSHLFDGTTTTTTQGPPNPYSFQYVAGRLPGHIDRVHAESGDGTGRVQGSYSFVDPKSIVRTVEYTVDENGYHPTLTGYDDILRQPKDSEAVRREKERHALLFQKIATRNSQGIPANLPRDTKIVANAKVRHADLYQKIAAEHAAIAAQREAQRLAYEATSVPNEVREYDFNYN